MDADWETRGACGATRVNLGLPRGLLPLLQGSSVVKKDSQMTFQCIFSSVLDAIEDSGVNVPDDWRSCGEPLYPESCSLIVMKFPVLRPTWKHQAVQGCEHE